MVEYHSRMVLCLEFGATLRAAMTSLQAAHASLPAETLRTLNWLLGG
ncbi:MAG TPA: hypothetical protein VGD49_04000 [Longimicrobiales bacterium]